MGKEYGKWMICIDFYIVATLSLFEILVFTRRLTVVYGSSGVLSGAEWGGGIFFSENIFSLVCFQTDWLRYSAICGITSGIQSW